VIPAVLMLDVCLLTALLLCAGGRSNPFCVLYLVHVAMAVVTLAEGWSWIVVGLTAICYGLLFWWPGAVVLSLSPMAQAATQWIALALVAGSDATKTLLPRNASAARETNALHR
jgi:hypothetical protein